MGFVVNRVDDSPPPASLESPVMSLMNFAVVSSAWALSAVAWYVVATPIGHGGPPAAGVVAVQYLVPIAAVLGPLAFVRVSKQAVWVSPLLIVAVYAAGRALSIIGLPVLIVIAVPGCLLAVAYGPFVMWRRRNVGRFGRTAFFVWLAAMLSSVIAVVVWLGQPADGIGWGLSEGLSLIVSPAVALTAGLTAGTLMWLVLRGQWAAVQQADRADSRQV